MTAALALMAVSQTGAQPTAGAAPSARANGTGGMAPSTQEPGRTVAATLGVHLGQGDVQPTDPKPGCRMQLRFDVENRMPSAVPPNVVYRVVITGAPSGNSDIPLPRLAAGQRRNHGPISLPVGNAPMRITAELQSVEVRDPPVPGLPSSWRRMESKTVDIRPNPRRSAC